MENIALAKGELVEALPSAGTAVLNLDDARVAAMAGRTRATVLGYTAQAAGDSPVQSLRVQSGSAQRESS